MPASDIELLDAWAGGDTRAAEELFDRHLRPLMRFFANKVADGADDLVQDTFLACVTGRDRFRRDSSFRTYLFATARNILSRSICRTSRAPPDRRRRKAPASPRRARTRPGALTPDPLRVRTGPQAGNSGTASVARISTLRNDG